jgi:hypothetical protein
MSVFVVLTESSSAACNEGIDAVTARATTVVSSSLRYIRLNFPAGEEAGEIDGTAYHMRIVPPEKSAFVKVSTRLSMPDVVLSVRRYDASSQIDRSAAHQRSTSLPTGFSLASSSGNRILV